VAEVKAKSSKVRSPPVVFYELDGAQPTKPWTAGRASLIDNLLGLAGAVNAAGVGDQQYYQISLEVLVARDPSIIFLGSKSHADSSVQDIADRPGWEDIRAVKEGRVYLVDDDIVSRPGPRIVEGLELLARRIHPELFR
jgi:iron complex transport system substrate-binding protein